MAGGISALSCAGLDAIGPYWQPRIGVAGGVSLPWRRRVAPAGRAIVVDDAGGGALSSPRWTSYRSARKGEELAELGIKQLGQLSCLHAGAQQSATGWAARRQRPDGFKAARNLLVARQRGARPSTAEGLEFLSCRG